MTNTVLGQQCVLLSSWFHCHREQISLAAEALDPTKGTNELAQSSLRWSNKLCGKVARGRPGNIIYTRVVFENVEFTNE